MSDCPILLKNGRVIDPAQGLDTQGGVLIENGMITDAGFGVDHGPEGTTTYDCNGAVIAPGLIDMRVFVGEPGSEHRETFASAGRAAAAGGITTFVSMPDTNPVIDDIALVDFVLRRARDTSDVNVIPAAALTKQLRGKEMTEIGLLKDAGAAFFSNGNQPLTNAQVMRRTLVYARDFDAMVSQLPQDPDLIGHGVMNEGEAASRLGLMGIPKESEIIMLERDLRLVGLTQGRYHAASISCADSVECINKAKNNHLNVTAACSINNLSLNENDIGPYRTFFKLAPPLRSENDRQSMVSALIDGAIDVIVSSHDPQDAETKRHPFAEAADGAIGLETLLSAALRLHHDEGVDLITILRALSTRPAELLDSDKGTLRAGSPADIVVFNLNETWIPQESLFLSLSKNSPFEGAKFEGRVAMTFVAGVPVYNYNVTA